MCILLEEVKLILEQLKSTDKEKVLKILNDLRDRSCKHGVETILKVDGAFDAVFNLIDKNGGPICSLVLSILNNFVTMSEQKIYKVNAISMLQDLLETSTDVKLIYRIIRLLTNLCVNPICLEEIQSSSTIIALIIRHGGSSDIKCQMSCIRAISVFCTSKEAVDNSGFSVLLGYLHSTDQNVIILVLRMMCELLKTEVSYHIESSFFLRLVEISSHSCYKDLAIKVLLLSLNSGVMLGVLTDSTVIKSVLRMVCKLLKTGAREVFDYIGKRDAIKFFVGQIKSPSESDSFKLAVQVVCLCATENISRGLMEHLGVLTELTNILNNDDYKKFHEIIVSALVDFQSDSPHSLNYVKVIAALLKYLDRLTFIQYSQYYNQHTSPPWSKASPSYCTLKFTPTGPYTLTPPCSVGFSRSSTQPMHDIMVFLASERKHKNSFFDVEYFDLPCFNALLNFIVLKFLECDTERFLKNLLKDLTSQISNLEYFDVMIKRRLIPRLFLRLVTGHSLESLTVLFGKAREKLNCNPASSPDSIYYDEDDVNSNLYFHRTPNCQLSFISDLKWQCESSHMEDLFSDILLSDSMELKEQCVVSMAYFMRSCSILLFPTSHMHKWKSLKIDLKDFLVDMMHRCEELSNETFVLLVESCCEIVRKLNVKTSLKWSSKTTQKEYPMERPSKYRKLDGQQVVKLCVCSGTVFECNKDKLAEGSQVFCRMLSDNYLDCQQPYINIRNVDEEAFEVLLHYINGCEVHIDEYKQCQSSNCDIKRIKGNNVVEEPNKSFSSTFAANVFICSDMYFVDNLKKNSEEFLSTCINNDNVVDLLFLAFQYHAETLLKDSLAYFLANCDCPLDRIQCFAEILYSSEKLTFIEHVNRIILEHECFDYIDYCDYDDGSYDNYCDNDNDDSYIFGYHAKGGYYDAFGHYQPYD